MQPHSFSVRLVLATVAACVSLFAAPGVTARADTNAVALADALTSYDGLYVAGGGRLQTDIAMDQLRKAQQGVKLPVYVIVLAAKDAPADAAAQDKLLAEVAGLVARSGTYVLFSGSTLRVHSTAFTQATTDRLTEQARKAGGKNPIKLLTAVIKTAGNTPQETAPPGVAPNGGRYVPSATQDKGESGTLGMVLLIAGGVVVALAAVGAVLFVRRRKGTAGAPATGTPATGAPATDTPATGQSAPGADSAGGNSPSEAQGALDQETTQSSPGAQDPDAGQVTVGDRPATGAASPKKSEDPA